MHSKCKSIVLHSKSVQTPIGVLELIACELGLHSVSRRPSLSSLIAIDNQSQSSLPFDKTTLVELIDGNDGMSSTNPIIEQTIRWLKWYFNGESGHDDIVGGDDGETRIPKLCTINYCKSILFTRVFNI